MNTRRSAPSLLLDKNFIFLNTKGLCLLCYEECPVQTLDKRQETTQTSVNFLRLVSRYLGFSVDNVVVTPLKKVGRKCATDKEQQNDKKFDKVGFELCERCASLAHAFCQVQFQVQFHQMILDRCVRSISEIIKDANKKTAAELFTMSEDADSMKKQQKTFTRLTMGGLRSATILRNKLYKRSMYKLSKSFPVIKLKRICKSGDWIHLLNKNENKDLSKSLPVDSKDVIFASLLGCVVSFWIVLSLSFINPEEYALNVKKEKTQPKQSIIPAMPLNCDELEIELKFPSKRKTAELSEPDAPKPAPASRNQRSSSNASIAQQQRNQAPETVLPPASYFQPVVIHKHANPVIQTKKPGSQYQPPPVENGKLRGSGKHQQYDPALAWKPKSTQYPTSLQAVPPAGHPPPAKTPVIMPPFATSSTQPASHYPHQPPPVTPPQYPTPPPTSHLSSSNYGFTYPSYPPNHLANNEPPPPSSSMSQHHSQYNHNDSDNINYNYNYNFTSYNYNSSSSWPSYNMSAIDYNPSYTPPVSGAYDSYNTNTIHGSDPGNLSTSSGYDYGYDYNNSYIPPPNTYQHGSSQYNMSTNHMSGGGMYSANSDQNGGGYNNGNESTSYTTLLPPVPTSNPYASTSTAAVPMEVDNTNTSTSDEPSLTHEDPQPLDSENSSMSGDDGIMENGNEAGGSQPPQLLFPETHWRQIVGTSPPISCKEPGCTEQFVTPIQLQIHLRTHGEFQCSFCHLTFSKAHNLAQHEKMRHCKNSALGKNKCPRCDYTSTSQYKYFLHFLTYHLRIPLYDKPCSICNKPFILGTKTINRKNHYKWYHDVEGKDTESVYTCKGCGAPFLKEAQLRDHQPNCTSVASVSSTESVEEIDYNTALATADQIVMS